MENLEDELVSTNVYIYDQCILDEIIRSFTLLPYTIASRLATLALTWAKPYIVPETYYLSKEYNPGMSVSELECINSYILWINQLGITELPRDTQSRFNKLDEVIGSLGVIRVI